MNKLNIRAAPVTTCSFTSIFNDNQIPVNPSYAACRSNKFGRKQRNIAHSAAEVEHAHPRLESGRQKKLPGPLFEVPCLQFQALLLLNAMSQRIVFNRIMYAAHL